MLARELYTQKKYKEAVESFKKSIELKKDYYYNFVYLGYTYKKWKKYGEAKKAFSKAKELTKSDYYKKQMDKHSALCSALSRK